MAVSSSVAATSFALASKDAFKLRSHSLPPPSVKPLSSSSLQLRSLERRGFQVRASEEPAGVDGTELINDLKVKWDAVENKTTVILYGGGAIVGLWVSSIVVGAINAVPLLPKLMELIGLGYTGWFVYRYLLFKSGRKELAADIESLKKKIAGSE